MVDLIRLGHFIPRHYVPTKPEQPFHADAILEIPAEHAAYIYVSPRHLVLGWGQLATTDLGTLK